MGLFGPSKKEKQLQAEIDKLTSLLTPEHSAVLDLTKKREELENDVKTKSTELARLETLAAELNGEISVKSKQIVDMNSAIEMQEYGIYKPHYDFANSDLYKGKLDLVREEQKLLIKNDAACTGNANWTVNNSAAKGRAMVRDMKKLLLRAFNVECDDIVANVKISNYDKSIERIYKIKEQISK